MTGRARRVAVAASGEFLDLDDSWPPFRDALVRAGLQPSVRQWDDPAVDWGAFDLVVSVFVWGYTARRREFLGWADRLSTLTCLVNSAAALAWNSDKVYLADLAAEGIPTVPTVWVPPGGTWRPPAEDFVVKPSVASGGIGAARYVGQGVEVAARHVRRLHDEGLTVMVQPYQTTIDAAGETALVFLGGDYSHAVHKAALLRADVGVTGRLWEQEVISPAVARDDQRLLGETALRAVRNRVGSTSYARVDVIDGPDDRPMVLEVELIEPSLFLDHDPGAAGRLVAKLQCLLG